MTTPNSEDVEASVPLINDAHDKLDASPADLSANTPDLSSPPSVGAAAVVLVGGGTADCESWRMQNLKNTTVTYKDKKVKRNPVCV
jgi:hypothetical protein